MNNVLNVGTYRTLSKFTPLATGFNSRAKERNPIESWNRQSKSRRCTTTVGKSVKIHH
jgi:hypothetical protein